MAEEDFVVSSEVAPISPEKENTPEKEKTPMEGGEMNEEDEDAFLYGTASAVEEEQAVARRVDGGEEKTKTRTSRLEK